MLPEAKNLNGRRRKVPQQLDHAVKTSGFAVEIHFKKETKEW
jgi:hypothetical protein